MMMMMMMMMMTTTDNSVEKCASSPVCVHRLDLNSVPQSTSAANDFSPRHIVQ